MDELRDYRFYGDDMVHPSKLAEDIIYDRFKEASLSQNSHSFLKEYYPIKQSLMHRIQTKERTKIEAFVQSHLKKIM